MPKHLVNITTLNALRQMSVKIYFAGKELFNTAPVYGVTVS